MVKVLTQKALNVSNITERLWLTLTLASRLSSEALSLSLNNPFAVLTVKGAQSSPAVHLNLNNRRIFERLTESWFEVFMIGSDKGDRSELRISVAVIKGEFGVVAGGTIFAKLAMLVSEQLLRTG